jgi:hypothetical protein
MRVGDLVTYDFQVSRWRKGELVYVGLVIEIETGKYTGNADVKVAWSSCSRRKAAVLTEASQHLRVISASR